MWSVRSEPLQMLYRKKVSWCSIVRVRKEKKEEKVFAFKLHICACECNLLALLTLHKIAMAKNRFFKTWGEFGIRRTSEVTEQKRPEWSHVEGKISTLHDHIYKHTYIYTQLYWLYTCVYSLSFFSFFQKTQSRPKSFW